MTGRPTKLTPQVQARIVEATAAGSYREVAARYAGIGDSTYRRWMARGESAELDAEVLSHLDRKGLVAEARDRKIPIKPRATKAVILEALLAPEAIYREFAQAVDTAEAQAEVRHVLTIEKASAEHWQAAAWLLERKYPDRYGQKVRTEISGPAGGEVPIRLRNVSDEDLQSELEGLLEAYREPPSD